eukprot:6378272-Alexandrium_andersonii.AAC.1
MFDTLEWDGTLTYLLQPAIGFLLIYERVRYCVCTMLTYVFGLLGLRRPVRQRLAMRDAQTQSQRTYTAVAGHSSARISWIEGRLDGCWTWDHVGRSD